MTSTITAMFDTRAEADAASERLRAASFDVDHVHVHDKTSTGHSDTAYSTHRDRGIWDSIKHAFLPDEDRHTYEEGVRRGGALLTAEVDDDRVDAAVGVLEQASSIDIDDRARQWRASGWNYDPAGVEDTATDRLITGQLELGRGSARARSYATDLPLSEQIGRRGEDATTDRTDRV